MDLAKIELIEKKVSTYQRTLDNSIIDIFEAEDLFDEIYEIFKTKMDKKHQLDAKGN